MERLEETDDWMWQEALGEEAGRICEESRWMVTGMEGWGVLEEQTREAHGWDELQEQKGEKRVEEK